MCPPATHEHDQVLTTQNQQPHTPNTTAPNTKHTAPRVDPPFRVDTLKDAVALLLGTAIAAITLPPVLLVVTTAVLWEAADRRFDGGLFESHKELTGYLMGTIIPAVDRYTQPVNRKWVKHPEDAFMVNLALLYGVVQPALMLALGLHHVRNGGGASTTFFAACFVYHVLRLGPYFMSFGYVYTMCHKEGHSAARGTGGGLWAAPNDKRGPLRFIFNWWIGLFYGVFPASFAVGHSINHHKYNNGPDDVVTTSDRPRDSPLALLCYLPRWLLYAANVSTTLQFLKEGKPATAMRSLVGSLWYAAFSCAVAAAFGPLFAFAYVGYPFLENVLLLACVNWSWHAFIDPDDPEDEYVQSITILGGQVNVLNEDSHVVHHQYPGVHWTRHAQYLEKHERLYKERLGSVFFKTHTFEIFGLVVAGQYDKLAERFVGHLPPDAAHTLFDTDRRSGKRFAVEFGHLKKPDCALTHDEAATLMKARLRACWWGPRARHSRDVAAFAESRKLE